MTNHPLPNLSRRICYRPVGFARPVFVLYFLSVALSLGVAGVLCAMAEGKMPAACAVLALPVLFSLLGAAFGAWTIRMGQVRRWWLVLVVTALWAACLVVTSAGPAAVRLMATADERLITLVLLGFPALFFFHWLLIFYCICLNDGFRVHYPVDGGVWGEQEFVYFRPGTGREVVAALEAGDAAALDALRGPAAVLMAPAAQNFTVLTLSTCPADPQQSAYIHLKDCWLGGGPFLTGRIHATMGISRLHHVMISPEELAQLRAMLPGVSDAGIGKGGADQAPLEGAPARMAERLPIGLPSGAPAALTSAAGSSIQRVPREEERAFSQRPLAFLLLPIVLTFVGLVGVLTMLPPLSVEEGDRVLELLYTAGTMLGVSAILFAVVTFFSNTELVRRGMRRDILARKGRLFDPAPIDLALTIEDSRAFERLKLVPDDIGLMRVEAGCIDIEAGRTRVHLAAEDVELSLHESGYGTALRIGADFGGVQWSITVSELDLYRDFRNKREAALLLWKRIYERLNADRDLRSPPAPGV